MKNQRTARVRIVNVKYKQVVRPKKFDSNQLYADARSNFDNLMGCVHRKPTAYFICVFGQKRGEVYRAWDVPADQDVISFADLPDVLKNIALRG